MSRDRFLRVHGRQMTAMLYRKVWGDFHCYRMVLP